MRTDINAVTRKASPAFHPYIGRAFGSMPQSLFRNLVSAKSTQSNLINNLSLNKSYSSLVGSSPKGLVGLSKQRITPLIRFNSSTINGKLFLCPAGINTNYKNLLVNASDFNYVSKKTKGSLSGCVVENKETGRRYLKKRADNLDKLEREFFIANLLTLINHNQPRSLIMKEIDEDGQPKFYTLSEMRPNSIDVLEFIKRGDWKERIAKKPLVGADCALAADSMFGKHLDIKFANLIIEETPTHHIITTIDHELANINYSVFTGDLDILASLPQDPQFIGKSEGLVFANAMRKSMRKDMVIKTYENITQIDSRQVSTLVDLMNDIFPERDKDRLIKIICKITQKAREFFAQLNEGPNFSIAYLKPF